MNDYKIYAVDFDGTLAKTKYPVIIKPIKRIIRLVKRLKRKGNKIILWTCRSGENLDNAVKWCTEQGIVFDAVNENLPEEIARWNTDPRKIGADYFIDDKNKFIFGLIR
ncbi:MAG TPA: hypothetical protein VN258_06265 [Mobilitalea sp.]|nr:hypothetical protein [Mobilitalea sp.]